MLTWLLLLLLLLLLLNIVLKAAQVLMYSLQCGGLFLRRLNRARIGHCGCRFWEIVWASVRDVGVWE